MLFDIKRTTSLDEGKLVKELCNFKNSGRQPYIFMNDNTISELAKNSIDYCADLFSGKIAMYHGHKVFTDNTLQYGEIELR